MSWTRIKQTGSGRIRARLVIEGLTREFCTDESLVTGASTVDGASRCNGLLLEGLVIDNGTDMLAGKIKASGFTAKIADVDAQATLAFAKRPTATTYLSATIDYLVTTVNVDSTSAFDSSGTFHIGTECISYSGKTSTSFTGCTRARRSTIAQSHYSSDGATTVRVQATNEPESIEGRRAYLYVYGDGDTSTGTGTQIFVGVVSRDATLDDGVHWTVAIDPVSKAISGDIGGDIKTPPNLRGIYYPAEAAMWISLSESTTASWNGALNTSRAATDYFCGFYETQSDFVEALNDKLATMQSGWKTFLRAVVTNGGQGWALTITTDSVDVKWLNFSLASPIDLSYSTSTNREMFINEDGTSYSLDTLAASTTYTIAANGSPVVGGGYVFAGGALGGVPRAACLSPLAAVPSFRAFASDIIADAASYPSNRIYIDSDGASTFDILTISEEAAGAVVTIALDPDEADDTSRFVTFIDIRWDVISDAKYSLTGPIAFQVERLLMSDFFAVDGLANMLAYSIPKSQELADIGGLPLLVNVFDSGYATTIESAQGGRPFAAQRRYSTIKKAKFDEYLAEELKLLALFPRLGTDGEIEFAPIQIFAPTATASFTIDASNELVSAGWSTWERQALGSASTLRILTGYNADEDKHTGRQYEIRDLASLARNRVPRVVQIAPKSTTTFTPSLEDVQRIAGAVLGIYGSPYIIAQINVPLTMFDAVPGSIVSITSTTLPNTSGTRGVTSVQGIVIHRRFALDSPAGALTLLLHGQNLAGYAPSLFFTSQANIVGNTWDLNIYTLAPPFEQNTERFATAGMSVRVCRWDSTDTSGDVSGVVVSATAGAVRVTFDGVWVPGGYTWILQYGNSDDADTNTTQDAYAYVAGSGATIDNAGTLDPARTFAP